MPGTKKGDPGPVLSPDQHARRLQAQTIHYNRQSRMPPGSRPRISPRANIPSKAQGITPDRMLSCRVCVEKPDTHPNDFHYLFRTVRTDQPVFVWLNIDGENAANRVYDSMFEAIAYKVRSGWEDASW